ncbi:SpoIIE family protein phosphatase [bacterium]|nr:SpoIIE family protein phosphatase [bacterium]
MDKLRQSVGAQSVTFYVQDPLWPDEFRLVAMPGVRHSEPMRGFTMSVRGALAESRRRYYDTAAEAVHESYQDDPPSLTKVRPEDRHLFAGFVEREGVVSLARFREVTPCGKACVLFVNFADKVYWRSSAAKERKMAIERAKRDIVARVDDLLRELQDFEEVPFRTLVRILEPVRKLADRDLVVTEDDIKDQFIEIAESALDVFGIDGISTIHLATHGGEALELVASSSNNRGGDLPPTQSVRDGEGLISWAALRKQALLIQDLATSAFRTIYVPSRPGMASGLVVPMMAGGVVLGVLNFESPKPNAFPPETVRLLWYLATEATICCRLIRELDSRSLTEQFLRLCHRSATKVGTSGTNSLHKLACLLNDSLGADQCDIWRCGQEGQFDLAGSSGDGAPPEPRANGWTNHIVTHGQSILLSRIVDRERFRAARWNGKRFVGMRKTRPVHTLSVDTIQDPRSLLLGRPIRAGGEIVGVAWMRFRDLVDSDADANLMRWADGFIGYSGLVIQALIHREHLEWAKYEDRNRAEFHEALFRTDGNPIPSEFPYVDCFAVAHPQHGGLGGDFFAIRIVNGPRPSLGVIVGDGEGHGPAGAIHMLPLITAFRSLGGASLDPAAVIERMRTFTQGMGVVGTCLYFEFRVGAGEIWVKGARAGHPHLLIIDRGTGIPTLFPRQQCATVPMFNEKAQRHALPEGPRFEDRYQLKESEVLIALTDGVCDTALWERLPVEIANSVQKLGRQAPLEDIARELERGAMNPASGLFEDDVMILVMQPNWNLVRETRTPSDPDQPTGARAEAPAFVESASSARPPAPSG